MTGNNRKTHVRYIHSAPGVVIFGVPETSVLA